MRRAGVYLAFSACTAVAGLEARAAAPRLFFSDLESGPKSGWEGSATRGVAVSVWGLGFGAARGGSFVTVGGAQLTADSDYAEWGAGGPARGLERITFWLQNACADGAGSITVTVGGVSSNPLPFTVRAGDIYFIAKDGDDANDGRLAASGGAGNGPWLSFWMASPEDNRAVRSGDVVYVRAGDYSESPPNAAGYSMYLRGSYVPGEPGRPYAVVGYPGEWPVIGAGGVPRSGVLSYTEYGPGAPVAYMQLHKLIWEHTDFAFAGHVYHDIRIAGNVFRNMLGDVWTGVIASDSGWSFAIYGNRFTNCGYDYYKGAIYPSASYPGVYHDTSEWEIAWNELDNYRSDVGGSHRYGAAIIGLRAGDPSSTFTIHDFRVHGNYFHDSPTAGAFGVNQDYDAPVYNLWFYNNVIANLGQIGSDISGAAIWTTAKTDSIFVYNNTFYNVGGVNGHYDSATGSLNATYPHQAVFWVHSNPGERRALSTANNIIYVADQRIPYYQGYQYGFLSSVRDLYYGSASLPSGADYTLSDPITADPQFAGAAAGDLTLLPSSPAHDTGDASVAAIVTSDYAGQPRPHGAAYDIGAHEYAPPCAADADCVSPPACRTAVGATCAAGTCLYPVDEAACGDASELPKGDVAAGCACTGAGAPELLMLAALGWPLLRRRKLRAGLLLCTLLLTAPAVARAAPRLFFSDLESGPKVGWEGSATRGAAVSVWGLGLGATRGGSFVTVGGAALAADSDYAEWGAIGPARGLERVTFWLSGACADGEGSITVTVNGVSSNPLPFTVRAGSIYYIDKANPAASDSNDGSAAAPWQHFYMVDPGRNGAFRPGDVIYVRAGAVYDDDEPDDGIGALVSINGAAGVPGAPYAVAGYPGEWPQLGSGGGAAPHGLYPTITSSVGVPSSYVEFHKLLWSPGHYAIWIWGDHWRFVGNRVENNTLEDQTAGVVATNAQNASIYGNLLSDNGYGATNLKHQMYVTSVCNDYGIDDCSETHHVDVAWNEIRNGLRGMGSESVAIKTWTWNTSLKTHAVYFHHNYVHDEPGDAIWLYAKVEEIFIHDNIFSNLNLDGLKAGLRSNIDAGPSPSASGTVFFFNNTLHDWGSQPYDGLAIMAFGHDDNWHTANNIFYAGSSANPVLSNTNGGSLVSRNDLFYGHGSLTYSGATGVTVNGPLTDVDPLFADAAARDYALQAGSPARDAGASSVAVTVSMDYVGAPRPSGAGYDIGAYEYVPTCATAAECTTPPPCRSAAGATCDSGSCGYPALADGAPCPDDGDSCTLDLCDAGACSHVTADGSDPDCGATCNDTDGDGHASVLCGGDDCQDGDPAEWRCDPEGAIAAGCGCAGVSGSGLGLVGAGTAWLAARGRKRRPAMRHKPAARSTAASGPSDTACQLLRPFRSPSCAPRAGRPRRATSSARDGGVEPQRRCP